LHVMLLVSVRKQTAVVRWCYERHLLALMPLSDMRDGVQSLAKLAGSLSEDERNPRLFYKSLSRKMLRKTACSYEYVLVRFCYRILTISDR
jgi:hypothetical protein